MPIQNRLIIANVRNHVSFETQYIYIYIYTLGENCPSKAKIKYSVTQKFIANISYCLFNANYIVLFALCFMLYGTMDHHTLMYCDTYRCRASNFAFHLGVKVSTFWHHRTWLWAAWWAAEAGGTKPQRVRRCSQWEGSSVQKKWSRPGSAKVRTAVWQVSPSLAADSAAARGELHRAKRRSETELVGWMYHVAINKRFLANVNSRSRSL